MLALPQKLDTKLAAVAADLLENRRPTGKSCWIEHGASRLAHAILKLRERGWPIQTEEIEVATGDGGFSHVAEYTLPPEVIAQAGVRGREFVTAVREARREKAAR